MIEEVKLENFISHKQTSLKLNAGISVFVGHNGAGKSSVIDAVTFALYGRHMRGDDNKNLVRRGASQAAVSVKFGSGAKSYLAERKIDAKGRLISAVLKEIDDGRVRQVAAGERRQMEESMAEEVRKITGLSFDMMKIATVVQQGELDRIITEYKPSEMKNLINEVIGIETLDKAYQAMKDALSIFKARLRERYQNYDTDNIDAVAAKIDEYVKERDEKKASLEELETKLDKVKEQEKELADKIKSLEQMKIKVENAESLSRSLREYVRRQRIELARQNEDLAQKIPKAKKSLQDISHKEEVQSELSLLIRAEEEFSERIKELIKMISEIRVIDIKKIENEIYNLKLRLSKNKQTILHLSQKIAQLREKEKPGERNELEARRDELTEKDKVLRSELGGIDEKIKDYEILKQQGVCPVCDTQVTPEDVDVKLQKKLKERDEKKIELERIDKELHDVQDLLNKMREYEDAQKSIEEYETQLHDAEAEKAQTEKEIKEKEAELQLAEEKVKELNPLQHEMDELSDKLRQVKKRKEELQNIQSMIKVAESFLNENKIAGQEDIVILEQRKQELELRLQAIPLDVQTASISSLRIDDHADELAEQIVKLNEETKGYDERLYLQAKDKHDKEVMQELDRLTEAKGAISSRLYELDREIVTFTKIKEELEQARQYVSIYEKIRKEVYNRDGYLATSIRSWALKQISKKASDYVREFGIGISQLELKEGKREVNVICYGATGEMPVNSMSGGEKVAIALALRFAIADLIGKGNVDFIVFDEPTTHLDEERRKSLVRLISQIGAGEGHTSLRQMIMITHDEEIFENSEVDAIFKFENTAEGTRVTQLTYSNT